VSVHGPPRLYFDFNADPEPDTAFHSNVDSDPDPETDQASKNNADP
jgi:hypothetical protein